MVAVSEQRGCSVIGGVLFVSELASMAHSGARRSTMTFAVWQCVFSLHPLAPLLASLAS